MAKDPSVNQNVDPGIETGPKPYVGPTTKGPAAVTPGPATGVSTPKTTALPTAKPTVEAPTLDKIIIETTAVSAAGISGQLQYSDNGQLQGTSTATWTGTLNGVAYNAITVNTTKYSTGAGNFARNGAIYFKDAGLTGFPSGSINFKAGGRATTPGFMIAPWELSFNNQPTRQDAGLGIWRSTQTGLYQRTQTTINGADNGPSVHGVYIADGALDFFPDYSSGDTAGLSYIILPAAFTSGTTKRYVGQISVNAYDTPGTPQWSLGWKQSSALSPTWSNERTPGNRNIIWDSNNHVSINDANLTQSLNVRGNIRIEATGANSSTGILFADGTFQYTAANGSGSNGIQVSNSSGVVVNNATGMSFDTSTGAISVGQVFGNTATISFTPGITVKDEDVGLGFLPALNFTGAGVSVTAVGNIQGGQFNIEIPGGGDSGVIIQEEGSNILTSANTINFVGSLVTASNVANVATITVNGPAIQEEGTNVVTSANIINFVGSGVTASSVGGVATVTVTASAGDSVYSLGSISGTTILNLTNGTIQTCTLSGDVYFDLNTVTSGKSITLLMTQGSGGNKLATYSSTVYFAAGYKTLSTAAGAIDMMNIVNIGGTYYATLTVGYAT